jgi:hypothetical protein
LIDVDGFCDYVFDIFISIYVLLKLRLFDGFCDFILLISINIYFVCHIVVF